MKKSVRLLSLVLAAGMTLSGLALPAFAEDTVQAAAPAIELEQDTAVAAKSGTCGTNLKWKLGTDGTLTISGTGAMTEFEDSIKLSHSTAPWAESRYNIKKVVIKEGVTSIGSYAFYQCQQLTSITVPSTVISIGKEAFEDCRKLTAIKLPAGLASIGEYAFGGCSALTGIAIPGSLTSIERDAFYYCSSLKSVTIANGVTSIGHYAFVGCDNLTSIVIPNSVTSIGNDVFTSTSKLKTITFTGTKAEWAAVAAAGTASQWSTYQTWSSQFEDKTIRCTDGDEAVELPTGYLKRGDKFTTKKITYKVTVAGSTSGTVQVVSGTKFSSSSCDIPATVQGSDGLTYKVTSIAKNAFKGNTKITKVTVGEFVETIGEGAFRGCTRLKSVNTGGRLTTIGKYAFYGDKVLSSLIISNTISLNSIGAYAFKGCSKLTSVMLTSSKLTKSSVKNCLSGSSIKTLTVPSEKLSTYKKYFAKSNSGKSVSVKAL